MAGRAWDRRAEMGSDGAVPAECLAQAVAKYVGPKRKDEHQEGVSGTGPRGPILVMDVGDNIGGGRFVEQPVLPSAAPRAAV
jgi:hypothetical protein